MKKKTKKKKRESRDSKELATAKLQITNLERRLEEKQELLTKSWERLDQHCELLAVFTRSNRMESIKRLSSGSTLDLAVKAFLEAKALIEE